MINFSNTPLKSSTGAELALYIWNKPKKPKAVIHINHGMSEHSARYDRFATALNKAGYHVIAHDHRGHGSTIAPDTHLGLFANSDGWKKVLADVNSVNQHIRETYPKLPIIFFGHSMGAIVGLNYAIENSDKLDACALWNSGVDGGSLLWVYGFLLSVERMIKGSDVPSALASKLTFETWNKKFAPNRTGSDWLSRDQAEVDKYVADPLCGFDACNGLWRDVLTGIKIGGDDSILRNIQNDLPMHLLAGGKDPCSDNGKAVERLVTRLKKAGVKDLNHVIHPDNRHEALNELNRDEITLDFIAWLDSRFAK